MLPRFMIKAGKLEPDGGYFYALFCITTALGIGICNFCMRAIGVQNIKIFWYNRAIYGYC